MIYDKLLSLYVAQLSKLETDIIKATNNVVKTDFSKQALLDLIQAQCIEEWHRGYFKDVLDYVKALEKLN